MKQLDATQIVAVARISRTPGFPQVVAVLEALAQDIKDAGFTNEDDSRALRLLHEGRGAASLVREFKAVLETIQNSADQLPQSPNSPDWR